MSLNLSDRIQERMQNNRGILQWLEAVLTAVDEPEKLKITIDKNEVKAICDEPLLAHTILEMSSNYQSQVLVYIGSELYGNNHPLGWS